MPHIHLCQEQGCWEGAGGNLSSSHEQPELDWGQRKGVSSKPRVTHWIHSPVPARWGPTSDTETPRKNKAELCPWGGTSVRRRADLVARSHDDSLWPYLSHTPSLSSVCTPIKWGIYLFVGWVFKQSEVVFTSHVCTCASTEAVCIKGLLRLPCWLCWGTRVKCIGILIGCVTIKPILKSEGLLKSSSLELPEPYSHQD